MKRIRWIVGALLLTGSTLAADNKEASAPQPQPVVVDPLDLRPPIPEPRVGLTEKYDGKRVRFTGHVQTSGKDTRTRTYWYELQIEIIHPAGVVTATKGVPASSQRKKKENTVNETVVVRVYFETAQEKLRPQKTAPEVTVEGKGEISLVDGALTIRQATVLDPRFLPKATPRDR